MPDDQKSISRNVASLNILVNDVRNLLYYEHWIDKRKYFYVYAILQKKICMYNVFSYTFFNLVNMKGLCFVLNVIMGNYESSVRNSRMLKNGLYQIHVDCNFEISWFLLSLCVLSTKYAISNKVTIYLWFLDILAWKLIWRMLISN